MLIKFIDHNTFDVFYNKGWNNWGRFKLEGKALTQTHGFPVPANIQNYLAKKYIR